MSATYRRESLNSHEEVQVEINLADQNELTIVQAHGVEDSEFMGKAYQWG